MIRLKVGKLLADREKTAYWLAKEANLTIPVAYRLAAGDRSLPALLLRSTAV